LKLYSRNRKLRWTCFSRTFTFVLAFDLSSSSSSRLLEAAA